MADPSGSDPRAIDGGPFLVDVTRPLADAGGGIVAFAASDRRDSATPLMALQVDRHAPIRARALLALAGNIEGLLRPLAQGVGPSVKGQPGCFVVCNAPAGPPLSADLRPWPESEVIAFVMVPIARMLDQLQTRGLTHRGIRANNVFRVPGNKSVVLGAAWSAPPAMHQPAVYETPYSAFCHKAGRGEGSAADDVYALGVLMATLALGHVPMQDVDEATIPYRKLELGDFAAVMGGERLSPILAGIVRGMLAEDPEHRPPLALLRDPAAARGRRLASRPPPRAARPFKLGATAIWNSRTLAYALAANPAEALPAIQGGTLTLWLRRNLGDAVLAVKLEDLFRHFSSETSLDKENSAAMVIVRAIAAADVFMPLCWRGLVLFPDGLGPLLAAAQDTDRELERTLRTIVIAEATSIWAALREENESANAQRLEGRRYSAMIQIKGPAGGLPRLTYTLNPLMPCTSKSLEGRWIVRASEIPAALDAVAAGSKDAALLEPDIVAFIAARSERALDQELQAFSEEGDSADRAMAALRLLSEMQKRYHPAPLTGLTAWIAPRVQPVVERWKNRERRTAIEEQLKAFVIAGSLPPIMALLGNRADQAADAEGLLAALGDLTRLDRALREIAEGGGHRAAIAARLGQEIAAGVGLAAIAGTLIMVALG